MREIGRLDSNLRTQIQIVDRNVDGVRSVAFETQSKLDRLTSEFAEFVGENNRLAELGRAETRVVALRAQIHQKFGFQDDVRRSAQGTLKSLDEGLIYQENLTNILQNVYVKASGYWLSTALVALSEWTNGNREYCERAIEAAYRRNPSSTALFFALITRRQDRPEAALRWLKHYLEHQDPNKLTSDFATVLEAVAQGAFTAAGRDLVQEYLVRWRELLLQDPAAIKSQLADWTVEVQSHVGGQNGAAYSTLSDVSPEWGRLDLALRGAQANQPLIAKYTSLLNAETRMTSTLEDRVDDILDRLVRDHDPEEVPLRQQLAKIETVIKYEGRVKEAQAEADLAAAAFNETKSYLDVQTMSALRPDALNVSRATQKVAIGACADWFAEAHGLHTKEYRGFIPSDVTATFKETHSVAASAFQLPQWKSSFNRPLAELESSLAAHWDRHMNPWIDSLRYDHKKAFIIAGSVAGGSLLLMSWIFNVVAGFILAAIGFGIWALVINNRKNQSERAVAQATSTLGEAKKRSLHKLRDARADLTRWQEDFQEHDRRARPVGELIDQFRTVGASATSSLEHRVIDTEGWQ